MPSQRGHFFISGRIVHAFIWRNMSSCRDQIIGILLAAGRGSRFDPQGQRNKLLQRIENGDTVAASAAAAMLSSLEKVVAVVREDTGALADELGNCGCTLLTCAEADSGMAASIVAGLRQALDADGWIIALGDMPYVEAETIAALADALKEGADIAVPVCHGQRGNPVGFSRRHLSALLRLEGDRGARDLLQSCPVTAVIVDDTGVLRDIDTMQDLPYAN
jgi:molybdenum cofactor cytidylyltransferase